MLICKEMGLQYCEICLTINSLDGKENGFSILAIWTKATYTDEMMLVFKLPKRQDFRVTAVLAAAVLLATCVKTNKVFGFSRNGINNNEISSAATKTLG